MFFATFCCGKFVFFFKYAVSYVVSHVFNNIAVQPHSAAWFCYCQSFFSFRCPTKIVFQKWHFRAGNNSNGTNDCKMMHFKQKPNMLRLLFFVLGIRSAERNAANAGNFMPSYNYQKITRMSSTKIGTYLLCTARPLCLALGVGATPSDFPHEKFIVIEINRWLRFTVNWWKYIFSTWKFDRKSNNRPKNTKNQKIQVSWFFDQMNQTNILNFLPVLDLCDVLLNGNWMWIYIARNIMQWKINDMCCERKNQTLLMKWKKTHDMCCKN